tara:strand:- start:40 stop:237 length:198 start_codon:yes stop_codon:yes gene_type:complete
MPKYKNVTPELVEGFLDKFFSALGKGLRKQALKDLAKKDPAIAKSIKDLEKAKANLKKSLTKSSK